MSINVKIDYFISGLSCYAIMTREEDQLVFDYSDLTVKAIPANPYIPLLEHDINKGCYSKDLDCVLQNGVYQTSVFIKAGVSEVPATDEKIGSGPIVIRNGIQVFSDNLDMV